MTRTKTHKKALAAMNYDLFRPETISVPAPATIHTRLSEHLSSQPVVLTPRQEPCPEGLPSIEELKRLFERYNWLHFDGRLPLANVEYSSRMTSAGSYAPEKKLIRIGRRYHRLFPGDVRDTLKHEMIHMLHFRHDAAFKREAERIGCSVKAKTHPSLQRPPRYVYACPACGRQYPRQKRLRIASCGDCSAGGSFDPRFKLRLLKERPSATRPRS